MNFSDWYTDRMTVKRNTPTVVNNLTTFSESTIYTDIPCRIYNDSAPNITPTETAAKINGSMKVALSNDYTIQPGDELIISRGAGLGVTGITQRGFAGEPHKLFEPFAAVFPQLTHQEVPVLTEERA